MSGSVADEVVSRYGASQQAASQQVVAVLRAVEEVVQAQGLALTPTSYFAAIMSALDKPETTQSGEVTLAMLTLLGVVLPRVPNTVLRSKFLGCITVVNRLLETFREQAPLAKAALQCLSQLLAALDPAAWLQAVPAVNQLLAFAMDARPKVRKRAAQGLVEMMAGLQHSVALASASELVAKAAQAVLPGPELAARAAAAASNKQRADAEAAITRAVADALHLISTLKQLLPLLSAKSAKQVVDLLFKLYKLKQPFLTKQATGALSTLVSSSACHLAGSDLAELITVVVEAEDLLWDKRDADGLMALARLVESGLRSLARSEPLLAAGRLPRAVHALLPQLAAEAEGVRFGTAATLKALISDCIGDEAAAAARTSKGGVPSPLHSVVAAVASSLGAQYEEAWGYALPVVSELINKLGSLKLPALATPLLEQLGALAAGAFDAQEDGGTRTDIPSAASAQHGPAVEAALGSALRALGPPAVLAVLPLNIKAALDGRGEPRTWMLPLMRKHVRGAQLGYWAQALMPLAVALGQRSAAASAAGQKAFASSCLALEMQVWHCLPAFCSWATDLPEVYKQYVNSIAAAFQNRPDLQAPICLALQRMSTQVRRVLAAAGAGAEDIGYHDPEGRPSQPRRAALNTPSTAATAKSSGGKSGRRGQGKAAASYGELDSEDGEEGSGPGDGSEDDGLQGDDDISIGGFGGEDDDTRSLYGARHVASAADAGQHHTSAPEGYTEEVARASLAALRQFAQNWLNLLCKTFVGADAEARGHLAAAISAHAAIAPAGVVATLFRTALTRYTKVLLDSAAEVPPPDMITDGGADPLSRRCTYLELALCLTPGVDDDALALLYKAAKPGLIDKEAAAQKKAFKVLAALCEQRPAFLQHHLADVLAQVTGPSASACLSAAKRYRLRCISPLVVALHSAQPEAALAVLASLKLNGEGDEDDEEMDAGGGDVEGKRRQVVAGLVSEVVLCLKEANTKTREAAYALLVALAHTLDDLLPPAHVGMDTGEGGPPAAGVSGEGGGLHDMFTMVMAGLVATTNHMISCSVMALARLTYQFGGRTEMLLEQLLPPVLSLLRTKSREVVKAVFGFVKVCAMRLPVESLTPRLPAMLEGLLLWCEDSRNKFKLKVRVIVERLARRCGFEAMAAAMPAGDMRLLSHIRKEHARKVKRKSASRAGSEMGDGEGDADARSQHSRGSMHSQSSMGRTARASEWGHTAVFSEAGDDDTRSHKSLGGQSQRTAGQAGGGQSRRQQQQQARGSAHREGAAGVRLSSGEDPVDLLSSGAARALAKSAAGQGAAARRGAVVGEGGFRRDEETGKMVIDEEDGESGKSKSKRKRGGSGYDSDDSDYDDMKGVKDLDYALRSEKARSVKYAESMRSAGGRSLGGASAGGRSQGGRSTASAGGRTARGVQPRGGKDAHSGDRFKPKNNSTGGDVKGKAKVEPYSYYKFDRTLLNRRRGKAAGAAGKLSSVVEGAAAGAAKGAKAKRMSAVKKRRTG